MYRSFWSFPMWFRPVLALVMLAILAACGTPQDRCIKQGAKPQRQLLRGIAYHEKNISRGYAIHTQTIPTTFGSVCRSREGFSYTCMRSDFRTFETPVAIDVTEERRKLDVLKQTLPQVTARAEEAAAQCRASYPDERPGS